MSWTWKADMDWDDGVKNVWVSGQIPTAGRWSTLKGRTLLEVKKK